MRALSSLTNRIFLACTLLALLSLGFALYFVNERVSSVTETDLRKGVVDAGTLVEQHRATLTDNFTRFARFVADLPRFKAVVETADPPTVQPVAREYRQGMGAALVLVTGRDGHVLSADGVGGVEKLPVVNVPAPTSEVSMLWPHDRGLLQVVSVPVFVGRENPDVFGRLLVGFLLDDALAQQFRDVTGTEIAFGAGNEVLAASLPKEVVSQLAPAMRASGLSTIRVRGEEYVALRRPLGGASGPDAPAVLILRSGTERLRFLRTIRTGLIGALIVTVLLATIVSYAVARTITRPLAAVATAMKDVAATGDLTRKISLRRRGWDDEDARLLATAFNTLTESIARFQREAAQKERLSALGRLSTVIAHEIRNPLMIIRTSLRSLRRDAVTAPELREAVADIDEETNRLNRVVTEVLDFARPIRFDYADAPLNAVCAEAAQAAESAEAGPAIALDLDPSDPHVVTDGERLRTALVNILTNARHAVSGATAAVAGGSVAVGGDAPIQVRTRGGADRVSITIADRGVGIAPEDMAHIFDPYFTTRRAGTGLGLPIARNIIDGLGGTMTVSSRIGEGTEIRIDLPVRAPDA